MIKSIKAFITCDLQGYFELWQDKPTFDRESGTWFSDKEMGSELPELFQGLSEFVLKGQCLEISFSRKKCTYDYFKTPEGHLMEAVYGKRMENKLKSNG